MPAMLARFRFADDNARAKKHDPKGHQALSNPWREGGAAMNKHYPGGPGFVAESATSASAAEAAEEFSSSMADRCERWFKAWTEHGQLRTCEECEIAAKKAGGKGKHESISARIRTDLFIKRRCLYKIGTDRLTGNPVKVWYLGDTSKLIADEMGRVIYQTRRTTSGRPAVLYGWGYRE
jgi:hypothetical protein